MTTTHPEMTNTPAERCTRCFDRTFSVAIDCADTNRADRGLEYDYDAIDAEARKYVATGTVSAYHCDDHDPINVDWFHGLALIEGC